MIGRSELRLQAARGLAIEINDAAWATVSAGEPVPPRLQGEMRAIATHCTEEAVDIITDAFRYAGGRGIYRASPLQRALRDINVAAQHLMVSEIAPRKPRPPGSSASPTPTRCGSGCNRKSRPPRALRMAPRPRLL